MSSVTRSALSCAYLKKTAINSMLFKAGMLPELKSKVFVMEKVPGP